MKALSAIRACKAQREDSLFGLDGVTGVDVGRKITKGKVTEEVAIRVYVDKKVALKDLAEAQRIPKEIDGVKTDVIERRYVLHTVKAAVETLRPMADTGRYAPLVGGISIGPCTAKGGYVYTGTLGCLVRDRASGATMALTNYHVIAEKWATGEKVCQPSRVDTGACPADVVAELTRSVLSDKVDGAVAKITGDRGTACEIQDLGKIKGKGAAAKDMKVRKRGRTTGLTFGVVDSIDLSVSVPYDDGPHILKNQISITADPEHGTVFGQGGDSGSVVVDGNGKVVGLYFAGTDAGDFGVANPIEAVLEELEIDLCTAGAVKPPFVDKPEIIDGLKRWIPDTIPWKRIKDAAFDKPPALETIDWDWQWRVDPPVWAPRDEPGEEGVGASLEARLQALEQRVEVAAAAWPPPALIPPFQNCVSFASLTTGLHANPLVRGFATFRVFGAAGAPLPATTVVSLAGQHALRVGPRVRVTHGPLGCVRVRLARTTQAPTTLRAFNAAGVQVVARVFALPPGAVGEVELKAPGIVRVEIQTTSGFAFIFRYCHCGLVKVKPEKPEPKELKEVKEFKDKPEPKELKEKPEPKELKEKPEPKEVLEGPGGELPLDPGFGPGDLEARLARLEAAIGGRHFIDSELRPDLQHGALKEEPDQDDLGCC